jgi:hypothetical protein
MRELCGLTEVQCAVVSSVYRRSGTVHLIFIHDLAHRLHCEVQCILCGNTCFIVSSVA